VKRPAQTVFRFDLDKTYLATDTDSLRALLRVPFERAEDKRTIPGVVELVRSLRQATLARGEGVSLYFLSASPPQIGAAIRAKLAMDGIVYDDIRFKDQMRHLVRGELSQLREQIGYKLTELLRAARSAPEGASEYLFGDDWESDAFIYSLYADIVAGRIEAPRVLRLLEAARADDHYIEQIEGLLALQRPRLTVAGILILRARKRRPEELAAFGNRLAWFDNYFECALRMAAAGLLEHEATARVAAAVGLDGEEIAASFAAMTARPPSDGPHRYGAGRVSLERSGMARGLDRGRLLGRLRVFGRSLFGRPALPLGGDGFVPDYESLVGRWTHRGMKSALSEAAEPAVPLEEEPVEL
jgi:hypothetical protein